MGISGKFVLCGHSLGAYIAMRYALKNPQNVAALILVSPAGLTRKPRDFSEKVHEFMRKSGCVRAMGMRLVIRYWRPGASPFDLLRALGRGSKFALRASFSNMGGLEKEEREDFLNYMYQTLMRRGSGEYAMSYLLEPV